MPAVRSALVSGVTGFLGSALARRLAAERVKVFGLARAGGAGLGQLAGVCGLELLEVRGSGREGLARALHGVTVDAVYNLAAAGVRPGGADLEELLSGNVHWVIDLVRCLGGSAARRFVHTGTCFEYGACAAGVPLDETMPARPFSLYGATKLAGQHLGRLLAREAGLPFVTLRLFGAYGPGEAPHRLVPYLVRALAADQAADLTPGAQVRDWLYVEDAAEALWVAGAADGLEDGAVYNVCSGSGVSVREVGVLLAELLGKPAGLLRWGARAARDEEPAWIVGDPGRFRRATGWAPRTPLREGLAAAVAHYRPGPRQLPGTRAA
jgi:nucleoside-diphosphate-sugar epimerase